MHLHIEGEWRAMSSRLAEVDGNRTHHTPFRRVHGFEDQGSHQTPVTSEQAQPSVGLAGVKAYCAGGAIWRMSPLRKVMPWASKCSSIGTINLRVVASATRA